MANNKKSEVRHLTLKLLDPDKFVKARELKEITNPVFFSRDNIPTDDGLLSNAIFGITKTERAETYAYVDLGGTFLNPLCYKTLCKLDSNIKSLVHGLKTFSIDSNGYLVEDPEGKTGLDFLKKNIDKIKFKSNESGRRDRNLLFIEKNRDNMFITKMIIIPPYYRDVNTNDGAVGVGDINKLYSGLLIATQSLRDMKSYGFDNLDASRGRIQEKILEIYRYFGDGPIVNGSRNGNLAKKYGLIRRAVLSKTIDYGSRLVLSAPINRVNSYKELPVDMKRTAIPLASAIVNYYPFVLFHLRRLFENQFADADSIPAYDKKNNKVVRIALKDPMQYFNDAELKKQMDIFIHSYDNRFVPIMIPTEKGNYPLRFKGYNMTEQEFADMNKEDKDPKNTNVIDRDFTWCDALYMAAVEAAKNKAILITRYPVDRYLNQFATGVVVSSTKQTIPMIIDGRYYPRYPLIRQEDIGRSTGNKFVDTLVMCNAFLLGIGGDYDGDQVSARGVFSEEANKELLENTHSRKHYIDLGATSIRISEKEAVQAIYNLTLVLPDDENKMTDMKSIF